MATMAAAFCIALSLLSGGEALSLRSHAHVADVRGVDLAKLTIGERLDVSSSKVPCETKYCLPADYHDRTANDYNDDFRYNETSKTTNPKNDEWQLQVYQYARSVVDQLGFQTVADVGCGSGYKLVKFFGDKATTGYDLEPTLTRLKARYPEKTWKLSDFGTVPTSADLVISADAVEHIPDVDAFTSYLLAFKAKYYVVSTPDRSMGLVSTGPPKNVCHVREWNHDEFAQYLEKRGFHVLDARAFRPQKTMWFLLERRSA